MLTGAKYICKICHRTSNFFYLHQCEGNFSACNEPVCSQQPGLAPVYCVMNHSTLSFCRPVCVAGLMCRYWKAGAARFPPVILTTPGWFPSLRHFLGFGLGSWIKQHCVQRFFTHTLIYCWLYWPDSPWLLYIFSFFFHSKWRIVELNIPLSSENNPEHPLQMLSVYPVAVISSYHSQVWLRLALLFCSFTPAQL